VHETLDRHVRVFAARVGHFEGRSIRLFKARDDLATYRTIGIVRSNQVKKMGSYGKCKFVAGEYDAGAFFVRKSNLLLELLQVRDSILKLPFPVVPEFGCHVGPETWRERKEPLVGGFS
jgi:hypothetical protein